MARASSEPGRTRQLNFFDLAGVVTLVDMPGYGYARASKDIKADWQGMMFDYLRGRPTLRRVMLLLDARIELKQADHDVMASARPCRGHLPDRADQVRRPEAGGTGAQIGGSRAAGTIHAAAFPQVLHTSSETGDGVPALRGELATLLELVGDQ